MTKGESTMQRIAVLSDAETATGYRLAGATVIEASPEDALRTLELRPDRRGHRPDS